MTSNDDAEGGDKPRPPLSEITIPLHQPKAADDSSKNDRSPEKTKIEKSDTAQGMDDGDNTDKKELDLEEAAALFSTGAELSPDLLRDAIEAQRSLEKHFASLCEGNDKENQADPKPKPDAKHEFGVKHVPETKQSTSEKSASNGTSREGPPVLSLPRGLDFNLYTRDQLLQAGAIDEGVEVNLKLSHGPNGPIFSVVPPKPGEPVDDALREILMRQAEMAHQYAHSKSHNWAGKPLHPRPTPSPNPAPTPSQQFGIPPLPPPPPPHDPNKFQSHDEQKKLSNYWWMTPDWRSAFDRETNLAYVIEMQRYALSVHPSIDSLVKGGQVAIGFTSFPVKINDLSPPPHHPCDHCEYKVECDCSSCESCSTCIATGACIECDCCEFNCCCRNPGNSEKWALNPCLECGSCGICSCCVGECCCGATLRPSVRQPPREIGCDTCRERRKKWQESGEWKLYGKNREAVYEKEAKKPRIYVGIPRLITKAELGKIEEEYDAEQAQKTNKKATSGGKKDAEARLSPPQVKAPQVLSIRKPSFDLRSTPQQHDQQGGPLNRAAIRHRVLVQRVARGVVPIPEEEEDGFWKESVENSPKSDDSNSTVIHHTARQIKQKASGNNGQAVSPSRARRGSNTGALRSLGNGAVLSPRDSPTGRLRHRPSGASRSPGNPLPPHLAPTFGRPLPQPPVQKFTDEDDSMDDIYD